ncbi:uncharacterized protein LOC109602341 [Aethina tumida]|uniref:uncharacterized protein LOC109602341 n=1 Tax=Aethina tumida TaxID=116153 RepID=UPI00096B66DE|nr:uncharacterized protein LOC109602341 [Aethina tumida]
MNLDKVKSCLLIGNDLEVVLLKVAINYAERGLNVWFISPEAINNIPKEIKVPSTEVLKLITFLYLRSYEDLLNNLNKIQLWHRKPDMIILNGLDIYCDINSDQYNSLVSASICAAILDNASGSSGVQQTSLLIVSSEVPNELSSRMKVLIDMYFPFVLNNADKKKLYDDVVEYFLVK